MTTATSLSPLPPALKLSPKPPKESPLFWNERAGQWCSKIGYRVNSEGQRVRCYSYHGTNQSAAEKEAGDLLADWIKCKAACKKAGVTLPIWDGDEIAAAEVVDQAWQAKFDRESLDDGKPQILTIKQARAQYDLHRQKLIGAAEGLTVGSYADSTFALDRALTELDTSKPLSWFDSDRLVDFRMVWMSKVKTEDKRGISVVTAKKYLKSFKTFIEWAHKNPKINYRNPENFADIFRFKRSSNIDIEIYKSKDLATLLNHADDRMKLYLMFCINFDATQNDIATIKHDHLKVINGEHCIKRRRRKAMHVNDFHSVYYIWPETLALMNKFKATKDEKKNPLGRMFLTPKGKPLMEDRETDVDGEHKVSSSDLVGGDFKRFVMGLKDDEIITRRCRLKDIRKTGMSWMHHNFVDNGHRARLFAGQALQGSLKQYAEDDFKPLTEALKQWRLELIAAGVFKDCTIKPEPKP